MIHSAEKNQTSYLLSEVLRTIKSLGEMNIGDVHIVDSIRYANVVFTVVEFQNYIKNVLTNSMTGGRATDAVVSNIQEVKSYINDKLWGASTETKYTLIVQHMIYRSPLDYLKKQLRVTQDLSAITTVNFSYSNLRRMSVQTKEDVQLSFIDIIERNFKIYKTDGFSTLIIQRMRQQDTVFTKYGLIYIAMITTRTNSSQSMMNFSLPQSVIGVKRKIVQNYGLFCTSETIENGIQLDDKLHYQKSIDSIINLLLHF